MDSRLAGMLAVGGVHVRVFTHYFDCSAYSLVAPPNEYPLLELCKDFDVFAQPASHTKVKRCSGLLALISLLKPITYNIISYYRT